MFRKGWSGMLVGRYVGGGRGGKREDERVGLVVKIGAAWPAKVK